MVSPLSGANSLGPSPRSTFDVDAFMALYGRAKRSHSAFEHEVIDKALDDLVAHPTRKASGNRLAANLRRTARQRLLKRRRPLTSSELVESARDNSNTALPEVLSARAAAAAGLVARAVDALPLRRRRALRLSLSGGHKVARRALGVGERQFRSLLSAARGQINGDGGAVAGREVLEDMFRTDRWAPAQAISSTFGKLRGVA